MKRGAQPTAHFSKQVAAYVQPPLTYEVSGEFTASKNGITLGAARLASKVVDAWISVGGSGRDDSNTLSLAANIKINGTTCLSTQPAVAGNNGSASEHKTTKITGDTGITQAAINPAANTANEGDIISLDLSLTRTASPTTEMSNIAVVVEFEPIR